MLRIALPELSVGSAGIGALVGHPADPNAAAVAAEQGLDVSAHAARQLDATLIAEHDLILAMDNKHIEWINQNFQYARGRVFLFGHWDGGTEVPDPYRQSLVNFRKVCELMQPFGQSWIKRLGGKITR